MPTDEEIGKAYDQGKEAIIVLFHDAVRQLAARIQVLEDRTAKMRTPYVPAFVSTTLPA